MFNAKPEPVEINRFTEREEKTPRVRPIGRRPVRSTRQRPASSRSTAWQSTALFSVCLLLVLALGLAFYTHQRSLELERELIATRGEIQASLQELRAGVEFDSQRQRLLLGMRDEILRVNGNVSLGEAYHYAETLLDASDKYASLDPLLLLSIGIVESGYNPKARSHADARGLYQIWPSTGRMLAGMLGWEYSDALLYEVDRNTEMAALYLDILLTTYNDPGLVLAEYNGGPINAGYYRAKSHRTAPETMDYVPKVLENYARLSKELPSSPGHGFDILYRDAARDGKQLLPAKID